MMYRPTYHEPHDDRDWDEEVLATTIDVEEDGVDSRPIDGDVHAMPAALAQTAPAIDFYKKTAPWLQDSMALDLPDDALDLGLPGVKLIKLPSVQTLFTEEIVIVGPERVDLDAIEARERAERAPQPYVDLPIGKEQFENLSGTAGTGKTWMAKKLAGQSAKGSIIVAATTGIAAVNLADSDVETTTINAALRYFNTEDLREKYQAGILQSILRKHRRSGIRRILIDEKSMMNGDQLTYISRAVDEVNTPRDRSLESVGQGEDFDQDQEPEEHPQIGVTLVGDFGQLPPVPDDDPRTGKKMAVKFCFDSPEWKRYAEHTTILTKIWRQDNQAFVQALHAVRKAEIVSALRYFTPDRFESITDDSFEGTTIFAKNEEVDRYNLLRLDRLSTPSLSFETVRKGQQRPDWKNIPNRLTLKEGALVMILSNHRLYEDEEDSVGKIIYANGDLGTVRGLDERRGGWLVSLHRGGDVCVFPIVRENTIPLEPGRKAELQAQFPNDWKSHLTEDGRKEIIGTVFYMPLRLAYGCTVHKTQGLTLDKVQVNIRDPFFKQPGMLFVALSRARTIEGLRIVGNQVGFVERCRMEPRVLPWL